MKSEFKPKSEVLILVAEDDNDDYFLMQEALEEAKISNPIKRVVNGEELIDYLKNRSVFSDLQKNPEPGLIFLDLNMPKMDGREALDEIKKDTKLRKIPTVVLTTSKRHEDILRSYEIGANSFIVKPIDFLAFVEVLKTFKKYWLEVVSLPKEEK